MAKILRSSFVLFGIVLLAQACAWAAPAIQWTDAVGAHQVDLVLIANPDYNPSDPDAAEGLMVWAPTGSWSHGYKNGYIKPLEIDMNSVSAMSFTGSGNFMGPDDMGVMKLWKQIKVKQQITNHTDYSWTDFHLGISGGRFYKVWQNFENWNVVQGVYTCDFYADGAPLVDPGSVFYDGVDFKLSSQDANGDATFTLSKWPTYLVPEPGSVVALLSGMMGLVAFGRRRKA